MNKFVYLFGAGASRKALPIVNEMALKIMDLRDLFLSTSFDLSTVDNFKDIDSEYTKDQWRDSLNNDLFWLGTNAKSSASIDTFAKKLYLQNDNLEIDNKELDRLKVTLSVFIVCQQLLSDPDNRYDGFLASVIQKPPINFPPNIHIISWNYDHQLEFAMAGYTKNPDLRDTQNQLRVIPKFLVGTPSKEYSHCLKLNGNTSFLGVKENKIMEFAKALGRGIPLDIFETVLSNYAKVKCNPDIYIPMLSFAWEDEIKPSIVDKAVELVTDTEILVIIGYSFPFFNREVDRRILNSMANLKKVYIQSPDADGVQERFMAAWGNRKIDVVPIYDTDYFFLPNEM